jgi:peptidoglycan/LPS O-acetylase OafA/YrhL
MDSLPRRVVQSIAAPICMGALLAELLHSPRGFEVARAFIGWRGASAVLLASLALAASVDGVPLWLAQLTMALLVGACVAQRRHALSWLFDGAVVGWVGTVSYGIYLFHVPVIAGLRRLLPAAHGGAGEVFLIAFPATVALASLSFVLLERPILRVRSRLRLRERVDRRVASPGLGTLPA